MRACWWLLFCLLCAPVLAPAAVPEIPRFRLLGAGDGLPSTTIPALARDRAGNLGVATWDGLARYDGVSFKVWRHDPADPASLPGNVVQALHIDAADRIWVATENGGLSMMDVDRRGFRHYRQAQYPQMGSDDVFAITSRGAELWFGTFGRGLPRLRADGRTTPYAAGAAGKAWRPVGQPSALSPQPHAADARLRSKLAAFRQTMIRASCATSCAASASVPTRMMKPFTRGTKCRNRLAKAARS